MGGVLAIAWSGGTITEVHFHALCMAAFGGFALLFGFRCIAIRGTG
jgi:hypothetical protein